MVKTKEKVKFGDLSGPCKFGIVGGYFYMSIFVVSFIIGFVIGFTGAI